MNTLAEYRSWYQEEFGHPPGMKCIESFLKLHPEAAEDNSVITPVPEEFWRDNPVDG